MYYFLDHVCGHKLIILSTVCVKVKPIRADFSFHATAICIKWIASQCRSIFLLLCLKAGMPLHLPILYRLINRKEERNLGLGTTPSQTPTHDLLSNATVRLCALRTDQFLVAGVLSFVFVSNSACLPKTFKK